MVTDRAPLNQRSGGPGGTFVTVHGEPRRTCSLTLTASTPARSRTFPAAPSPPASSPSSTCSVPTSATPAPPRGGSRLGPSHRASLDGPLYGLLQGGRLRQPIRVMGQADDLSRADQGRDAALVDGPLGRL